MMNGWVYDGFEKTYTSLGVEFDSYYYESNTYLLGKDNIEEGLEMVFFIAKKTDRFGVILPMKVLMKNCT